MKITKSFLLVFAVSALFFVSTNSVAQTITTTALTSNALCAGDSISVSYTVTGTFQQKNAFTVQLSDSTGSFMTSFLNIGSTTHTTGSGTIVAGIPSTLKGGSHYRIRVIGSLPYTVGSDNGTDLAVGAKPAPAFTISKQHTLEGDTVGFQNYSKGAVSYLWDFGDGASIASSTAQNPPAVSYSTPGAKIISLTATSASGCTATYTISGDYYGNGNNLKVYSCNTPIPHEAQVDSMTRDYGTGDGYIWVQSGITFISETGSFIVFAEPGSSVSLPGTGSLTVYLKAGASYTGGATGGHVLIYEPGAGLNSLKYETLLQCSSLSFDYTNAPPNRFHTEAAVRSKAASSTSVFPNPAANMLYVETPEAAQEVGLINELGQQVLHANGGLTSKLELNISNYPAGTYYLQLKFKDRCENQKVVISR